MVEYHSPETKTVDISRQTAARSAARHVTGFMVDLLLDPQFKLNLVPKGRCPAFYTHSPHRDHSVLRD